MDKAKELASKFWAGYDSKISDFIEANGEMLEVRMPMDGEGMVVFSPKTLYFDKNSEIIPYDKDKKAAFTLVADYSDDLDYLVFWSLDEQQGSP